jgi:phage recombination protein Bet
MSPQTLVTMPSAAPIVTADQLVLIKKTVAKDATDDELRLYLYDCARQGVHPLDRLLHFTKRSGRYVPITSIDFMRIRAHATGSCAGIDDPIFSGVPMNPDFAAHITVYRMVQGQRCGFSATSRWREYKPDANDFMWKKMPFLMLGKTAEALALRKAFPQELAGLYESSEMDQAIEDKVNVQTGEITDAPAAPASDAPITQPQRRRLFTIATKAGWMTQQVKDVLKEKFGVESSKALPVKSYDDAVAFFESEKPPAVDPDQPF